MDRNQSVWQKPRIEDSKFSTFCLNFLIPECSISQTSVTFLPVVNYQGETSVFPSERDTSCSSSPSTGGQELGTLGKVPHCSAVPTQLVHIRLVLLTPHGNKEQGAGGINSRRKRDILKIAVMGSVEANEFKYNTLCKQKKNKDWCGFWLCWFLGGFLDLFLGWVFFGGGIVVVLFWFCFFFNLRRIKIFVLRL